MDFTHSYLSEIEEFFISRTQQGLMLTVTDIELVRAWEKRQIPVEIVKQGISSGIQTFLDRAPPENPLPRSMRYFRSHVETAFKTHQRALARGLVVTRPTPPPQDSLAQAKRVVDAWLSLENMPAKAMPLLIELQKRLATPPAKSGPQSFLQELDRWLAGQWFETVVPEHADTVKQDIAARLKKAQEQGYGKMALLDLEQMLYREKAKQYGYQSLVEEALHKES